MSNAQLALPTLDKSAVVTADLPSPLPEDGPPNERIIPVDPAKFLEAVLDRPLRTDEAHYLAGPPILFLEAVLGRPLRANEARYLAGPLVLYSPSWGGTIPPWLSAAIPNARVAQVLAEAMGDVQEHDQMCSWEETAAYLYTASLSIPLSQEWRHVYFWVFDQVMRAHGKLSDGQTVWDLINPNEEFGPDHRELSEYEQRECLDKLRRDIRRAVVRHRRVS